MVVSASRATTLALALGFALGGQEYSPYNESQAIQQFSYALVSHCTRESIEQWSCGGICDGLPTPNRIIFIGPGQSYGVQGYVSVLSGSDGQRSCSVALRGSKGNNWGNLIADLFVWAVSWPPDKEGVNTSWCPSCRVHAGFAGAHDELSDDIRAALVELKCTTATFHGHSLGAAVAGLSSMMTRGENVVTVPEVWTYGMPRVGNKAFVQAYVDLAAAQSASPPMWRVVHNNDLVPRAMPRWNYWGPRHVPGEVYYKTEPFPGPFDICPPEDPDDPSIENKTCMAHVPWSKWSAEDHLTYLGISLDITRDEECGFVDTPGPGFFTVAVLIVFVLSVLLVLVCGCVCPCCLGGCCCYRNCRRVVAAGKRKIGLVGSSHPLIDADRMSPGEMRTSWAECEAGQGHLALANGNGINDGRCVEMRTSWNPESTLIDANGINDGR